MIREASAVPESHVEARAVASVRTSTTRPFLWSVRRELWENRSIYFAPLITAGILLIGFAVTAIGLPERRRAVLQLKPAQQRHLIEIPYDIVFGMILLTVLLVWLFYCLDALYGERRDRSILFWKSLPVSDVTTVLSKASIPFVILPLLTFAITVGTQLNMLLLSNALLLVNGVPLTTSSQLPLFQSWGTLLYGLAAMTLWDAPIYGWLLLVSAWARRAPLLWAGLPLLGVAALEMIIFHSAYFVSFLRYRGMGWTTEAFALKPRGTLLIDPLNPIDPVKFVSSPHLWLGLALAAVFLYAAVRLRRQRAPL